ncbi:hypothetical protein FB472_1208 [Rhodoglobus vestalii]|uniref:Uncharacterized protein n=1 Tax=Rhodoglobus vestalii TaxID=193384 RepID=A0A8H2K6L7_9MICO|nr:hypothetical protein [Rhodoglobus vestalii]TQO19639.1 hypothetical protein FB472_1208 [Rhodoglobus vestalii]
MSNSRRPARGNKYRTGYLRSRAWFARRARWFAEETAAGNTLRCAACNRIARVRDLELHHVDYSGVAETPTGWRAEETHSDLVSLHPAHHELLHRLLDRDQVLRAMRSRPVASAFALRALRRKLAPTTTEQP